MHRLIRSGFIVLGLASVLRPAAGNGDVVAVVSARSAVTTLSKSEAKDIFLGKVSLFPNGTPAVPIDQPDGSAARDEFYTMLTGQTPAQLRGYWAKLIFTGRGQPPPTVSDSLEMKQRLSMNTAAIGYLDRSAVDNSVKVLALR
jgi:ABC-type phosphate transport system substrate-binding protein